MAKSLKLLYWPEYNANGKSAWRLSREDNEETKFPVYKKLARLFSEVSGGKILTNPLRFKRCILIFIPTRFPKKKREIFLDEVEKTMGLS